MGFFKDFKDDFSQALNELLPGDDFTEEDEIQVNTLDKELDVEQELSKLEVCLSRWRKNQVRRRQQWCSLNLSFVRWMRQIRNFRKHQKNRRYYMSRL